MPTNNEILNDESLMPYGKYKGTRMIDVPYYHLLWLYDNNKCDFKVKKYIQDNMDALLLEKQKSETK